MIVKCHDLSYSVVTSLLNNHLQLEAQNPQLWYVVHKSDRNINVKAYLLSWIMKSQSRYNDEVGG